MKFYPFFVSLRGISRAACKDLSLLKVVKIVKQDPGCQACFFFILDSEECLVYLPVDVLCGLKCYPMELAHDKTLKQLQVLAPTEKELEALQTGKFKVEELSRCSDARIQMVSKGTTKSTKHMHKHTCTHAPVCSTLQGKGPDLSSFHVCERSVKKNNNKKMVHLPGATACFLLFHSVEIKVLRNTFRDPPQPPG